MRRLLPILMLAACGRDGFEPGGDLGALRFDPPPSYREMWRRTEACSGRRGNFERIRWWVVPGVETFEYSPEKPYADGLWDGDGNITLAGGVLSHPMVVRHEMLHALGFGVDHPAVPFRDPCRATWSSWARPRPFSRCLRTSQPTRPSAPVRTTRPPGWRGVAHVFRRQNGERWAPIAGRRLPASRVWAEANQYCLA